jgi:hypothetical protein
VEVSLESVMKVTCELPMRASVSVGWGHPLSCERIVVCEASLSNTFQPLLYAIKAAGHANAQHKQRWYRAQAPFENPSDFQRALFFV